MKKENIFLLITLIILILTVKDIQGNQPKKQFKQQNYIVTKNETLWSIAEQYAPNDEDPREYIHDLEKINGNIKVLNIGQKINILVEEE